jgi:hypothetical protein
MNPDQIRLLLQLAQLQHHLDDAEVYSGTGHQDAAHLSLDDAEEGVEAIGQQQLPPEGQKHLEEVEEAGDKEEEEAGVEEPEHEQEEKIACFQLGQDVLCRQLGLVGERRELFKKVASLVALGKVTTAQDMLECLGSLGGTPNPKAVKLADTASDEAQRAANLAAAQRNKELIQRPDWQVSADRARAELEATPPPAAKTQSMAEYEAAKQQRDQALLATQQARAREGAAAGATQKAKVNEQLKPIQEQIAQDRRGQQAFEQVQAAGVPWNPQETSFENLARVKPPEQEAPAQELAMDPFSIGARDLGRLTNRAWQNATSIPAHLVRGAGLATQALGQGVTGGLTSAAQAMGAPQAVASVGNAVQGAVSQAPTPAQTGPGWWSRFGQGGTAYRPQAATPQQSQAASRPPAPRPTIGAQAKPAPSNLGAGAHNANAPG